jgi:hypothetical protein
MSIGPVALGEVEVRQPLDLPKNPPQEKATPGPGSKPATASPGCAPFLTLIPSCYHRGNFEELLEGHADRGPG